MPSLTYRADFLAEEIWWQNRTKWSIYFSYREADGDNGIWDSEILHMKHNHYFFQILPRLRESKVFMIHCLVVSREEWSKFILLPNYHFHDKNQQHPLSFLWSLLGARSSQFERAGEENAVLTVKVGIMCRII